MSSRAHPHSVHHGVEPGPGSHQFLSLQTLISDSFIMLTTTDKCSHYSLIYSFAHEICVLSNCFALLAVLIPHSFFSKGQWLAS